MISFPNAKINIGLNVIEKRKDGFHNIESIFYPIPFHDILEIIPSNNSAKNIIEFTNTGLSIDCKAEDNICVKAFKLLHEDLKIPAVKIHLHKIIPFGAGLGGGSSDAACTLSLLNNIFNLKLSNKILIDYALRLGSDCGFFITNKPQFVKGRGEILQNTDFNLSNFYLVLLNPEIYVSTKEAYEYIIPRKPKLTINEIINKDIKNWNENLINDFEFSVFKKHPEIKKLKAHLFEAGAIYASMSGSGSCLFGIFNKQPNKLDGIKKHIVWEGELR